MIDVAVLTGGWTDEYSVSDKSALSIMDWLRESKKYNPVLVVLGKNGKYYDGRGEEVNISYFNIVYNTIHGSPGENGLVQGYLELLGIKHTSCPVMASSITYSKYDTGLYCNALCIEDLHVPRAILVRQGSKLRDKHVLNVTGFPCFVKPNLGGSSIGASMISEPSLLSEAIKNARKHCDEVVVEKYIKGREFTCGIVNDEVIEVTEIKHGKDFFDLETKYSGSAEEVTPAQINIEIRSRIERVTKEIYDSLRCKGICRIDYILSNTGDLYLLEVNTTPGMTNASIIPQQVKVKGKTMLQQLEEVLDRELGH